jgi:hypothetical protein
LIRLKQSIFVDKTVDLYRSHCILLISKQLNIEDNSYKIVLNANKKKPVFFHFSVEEKYNYILFDPEDDDIEFRIVPKNTEILKTFPSTFSWLHL